MAQLAEQEGLLISGRQGRIELALMLGQLKEDGWITWTWVPGPPGTRDAEEPAAHALGEEHLHRIRELRVLPAAYQATAALGLRSDAQRAEQPSLEPEQELLLIALVEASRDVSRDQREFLLIRTFGGNEIQGGSLASPLEISVSDLEYLGACGLLQLRMHPGQSQTTFSVTPAGASCYESLHRRAATPLRQVEGRVRLYLESAGFRASFPLAHQRWTEAEELLWATDSVEHLTAIGHKAREAMQEFATALVELHKPTAPPSDPTKTLDRVSAVLLLLRPQLGERRMALLNALFAYWRAAVELVQRQEHGAQKEGEPLNWEDGRRVVFQTANVMVELYRASEQAQRLPSTPAPQTSSAASEHRAAEAQQH